MRSPDFTEDTEKKLILRHDRVAGPGNYFPLIKCSLVSASLREVNLRTIKLTQNREAAENSGPSPVGTSPAS
jgi:hypothetical protein